MNQGKLPITVAAAVMIAAAGLTLLRAAAVSPKGYPIAAKFGGKYLVRGGQTLAVEGEPPRGRIVVIEFDSLAAARSFEDSPDYQAITPLRHKAASSRVYLVEGVYPSR